MKIDIVTLLILLGITYIIQVSAFFVQYRINKAYKGLGFWVLGFLFLALGFSIGPLRGVSGLEAFVIITSNSFLVLGMVYVYSGITRFFGKKENIIFIIVSFSLYILMMLYFTFIEPSINIRTIITSLMLAVVIFLASYSLLVNKTKTVRTSANFNFVTLFIFGCFFVLRAIVTFFSSDIGSYFSQNFIQVSVFLVSFIEGILITLGLIIMVNQRLTEEMKDVIEQKDLIFNASPDGALVTGLNNGYIFDINEAFTQITGFTREDTIGKTIFDINIYKNKQDREKILNALREKGACENFEIELTKKNGTSLVGMLSAKIVLLNKIPCILSVTRDITEIKKEQIEKENLEAQNRQLQKAESLGLMAGAIAHHFNNQLQSVMGNIELTSSDLSKDSELTETLDEALNSAKKAAEVSKLMLAYLGQVHSVREPLSLSEVCSSYLPMIEASISKESGLVVDLENPGPVINSNQNQIQQILTNLITNSIEAGSLGPDAVRLTVKTVSSSDIPDINRFPVEWFPDKERYALLQISDNGCGIDQKDLERIFDPFFSSKFTGRGLGLSAVLGIIRTHNGAITVDSEIGRGTVLSLYMPTASEAAVSHPVRNESLSVRENTGTILLVDDEPSILKLASASIKRIGFSVISARDGVEAVEIFTKNRDPIVCVLLDLNMPRMNGWDTLAALRKLDPQIPVVLSSGYDESHAMAGDHNELPQSFLSKPYDLKSLNDAIQSAVNKKFN